MFFKKNLFKNFFLKIMSLR